jgi:solute carrier family 1 (high affinity glutamate transporter) protein 2
MELEEINHKQKEINFHEDVMQQEKIKRKRNFKKHLKSNIILISIIISTIIGFSVGITLKYSNMKNSEISAWLILPGKLFLRCLRLFIIPVIFFGVLNATSSLNTSSNTKLTSICFLFVFATHIIACLIGIAGSFIFSTFRTNSTQILTSATQRDLTQKTVYDIFVDILNNLIPKNIFKATMYQEFTKYELVNSTVNSSIIERKRITNDVPDTNVLGILTFAIIIGMATGSIGEKGQSFRSLIQSINHVVMKVLRWIILLGPIGFISLIIDAVLNINLENNLKELAIFVVVVVSCCLFYGIIVLSVACFVFTRKNPFKHYLNFLDPILLAFASTSSGVCIHRSIETCENKLYLNPIITRFSFPFYTGKCFWLY